MAEIISLDTYQRWDLAGIDGLALMKTWFSEAVERIAPFQSLETEWQGQPCSLLRLCEGNFRLSTRANIILPSIPVEQRVWLKQFKWLAAIALPEAEFANLKQIAIPKPPHRLMGLPQNCAVPARLNSTAVIIWRHEIENVPMLEIHTARADLTKVMAELQAARESMGELKANL
jgi:hypothetical protein